MGDSADPLAAHLRRLETGPLASLVADCWAARGYETEREGSTVVVQGAGKRHIRAIGADERGVAAEDAVDVVVAPGGVSDAAARVVDAAELAQLLRYAIHTDRRDAICERYLGAPPPALTVPRVVRIRRRARRWVRPVALAIGLLLCAAAGALVVVAPGVLGASDTGDAGSAVDVAVPTGTADQAPPSAVDPAADAGEAPAGSELPPGVGPNEIENVSRLAAAHGRAIDNTSYTLWTDLYRPRGGEPGARRVQRDMDIAVSADGRYLLETTVQADADSPVRPARAGRTVYHDGRDWFVARQTNASTVYRRVSGAQAAPTAAPDPAVLRERLVTAYLSTPEMDVTATRQDGQPGYLLVGRGPTSGFPSRNIGNYTVRAFVRPSGLVENVTVRGIRRANPPIDLRLEVTYDRVGSTTVTAPRWVTTEFGVNSSATRAATP